jgi:hypothetical protein
LCIAVVFGVSFVAVVSLSAVPLVLAAFPVNASDGQFLTLVVTQVLLLVLLLLLLPM